MLLFPVQVINQFINLVLLIENESHIHPENRYKNDEKSLAELGNVIIKRVAEKEDSKYIDPELKPFIAVSFVQIINLIRNRERLFIFF